MGIELKKFDTRLQAEGPEVKHLDPAAAPFYLPIGDEVEIFTAAYKARLPILLKPELSTALGDHLKAVQKEMNRGNKPRPLDGI